MELDSLRIYQEVLQFSFVFSRHNPSLCNSWISFILYFWLSASLGKSTVCQRVAADMIYHDILKFFINCSPSCLKLSWFASLHRCKSTKILPCQLAIWGTIKKVKMRSNLKTLTGTGLRPINIIFPCTSTHLILTAISRQTMLSPWTQSKANIVR